MSRVETLPRSTRYSIGRLVPGGKLWAIRDGQTLVGTAFTRAGAIAHAAHIEQADINLARALATTDGGGDAG